MHYKLKMTAAIVGSFLLGAGAIQALHAQAKPPAFVVAEVNVKDRAGFEVVPSVTSFTLPIYSGIKFHVPSLVETLQWTWRAGVSHVELATPGPMGLVGLLVAKVLPRDRPSVLHSRM